MDLVMTMLQRDAKLLPRRRWFYMKRMAFAGAAGAMILVGILIATSSGSTTIGLQIFQAFASSVLLATCIISALAAGLPIIREKRNSTLGLLFLTDLSCAKQIQGRFAASICFMLLAVSSLFPMFLLSASLGGIAPVQIISIFLVLGGIIVLSSSIGLLAASICSTERTMVTCGGIIAALVFGSPSVFLMMVSPRTTPGDTSALLHIMSSFAVTSSLSKGLMIRYGLWNCLYNMAMSIPLLLATGTILRGSIFRESNANSSIANILRRRWKRLLNRTYPPMPIKHTVTARDMRFVYGGYRHESIVCIFVSAAVGIIAYMFSFYFGADSAEAMIVAGSSVAGVNTLIFGLGTILRGARAIRTENDNRTMPLLLGTAMSDGEVIWGKVFAVMLSTLPWFIGGLLGAILASAMTYEFMAVVAAVGSACYVLSSVFGITCASMTLSLWFKTPALLAICFPVFLIWNSMFKWQLGAASVVVTMIIGGLAGAMGDAVTAILLVVSLFLTCIAPDVGIGLSSVYILKRVLRRKALRNE